MKGKYVIFHANVDSSGLPADPMENPLVKRLLKMLDHGANVRADLRADGALVIRATGGKPKKRAVCNVLRSALPPLPDGATCKKRALEAQREISGGLSGLRRNLRINWREPESYAPPYDAALVARQKQIGRAVAVILARRKSGEIKATARFVKGKPSKTGRWRMGHTVTRRDQSEYEIMDAAAGRKVERESDLRLRDKGDWIGFIVRQYAHGHYGRKYDRVTSCGAEYNAVNAIREIQEARADLEYWREMETLTKQRQHFKPGLSNETACPDDEVAA